MNNININKNSNQSGRSMIEMLGVLAIVGVLSVGGIAGYSKAMEKFKINKHIDHIAHITTNIRTLYMQQNNYGTIYPHDIEDMGVLPDGVSYNNYKIDFGDNISADIRQTHEDNTSFGLALNNISNKECIELASNDWGSTNSGIRGIIASSQIISAGVTPLDNDGVFSQWGYEGYFVKNPPMNVATASQYCNCTSNTCSFLLIIK